MFYFLAQITSEAAYQERVRKLNHIEQICDVKNRE